MNTIPVRELARRICVANHTADLQVPIEFRNSAGEVPCSAHLRQAKLYIGLVTDSNLSRTFGVLVDAHRDLTEAVAS